MHRKALLASFPGRVLHHGAVAALLQLEAAEGSRGGQPERDAAARGRRQRGRKSARLNSSHRQSSYGGCWLEQKRTRLNSSHSENSYGDLVLKEDNSPT